MLWLLQLLFGSCVRLCVRRIVKPLGRDDGGAVSMTGSRCYSAARKRSRIRDGSVSRRCPKILVVRMTEYRTTRR